jgi:hypothetical protein
MTPKLTGIKPGDVVQFFEIPNQPLPSGLSLNPVTGVISGIPTVPPGSYFVQAWMSVTRDIFWPRPLHLTSDKMAPLFKLADLSDYFNHKK